MNTQTTLPIDRQSVSSLSKSKNEPAWMSDLRLQALELAGKLEWPKLEKMRLDRWETEAYGSYAPSSPISSVAELPQGIKPFLQDETADLNIVVQCNSSVVYSRLSDELRQQGVVFTDLESAVRDYPQWVQPYFMKAVSMDEHKIAALHAAVWNGGVFLYVPRNVHVNVPLQGLFYSDDPKATFAPHVLIVAEENSSVTYVDNIFSENHSENYVRNGIVEIFVKSGAHVSFASVHHMNEKGTDFSFRRAIVEKDGKIEWIVGELNDGNTVSDTTSVLKGDGSFSDAKVITVGTKQQKAHITTRVVHYGKMSESNMITRAVMRDEATSIVNGITKIEKGATGANGEQTERVLMLSPLARGDANPILLIDEDDVKAGHAASVGKVNPEQVFYMMSRGISKEEAEKLIIYGFLAPVVSEIPIQILEKRLQSLVERKLGQ